MKIPFCQPFLNESEANAVSNAVKSRWITTGKITEEAEKQLAYYLGAKYVVLVTSCTAALHLSYEYFKKKSGKKTFKAYVPSLTFAATATEVVNAGGEVIFGDVGEDLLLKQREGDFDIAVPVHLTGKKAYTNYPEKFVVEDSAHLFEQGQMVGNNNLVCFSFYATKNLTMGEGGCIATNDEEAYNFFKKARHHGISKDGWKRYEEGGSWRYDIEFIGWKYNPSDVLASMILVQLGKVDLINKERQRVVDLYNLFLGLKNTGLHLYPVMVEDQDKFISEMAKEGIQCSVHFQPLHLMTAFKDCKKDKLTNTELYGNQMVSLPLYPELTNHEVEEICKAVKRTNLLKS